MWQSIRAYISARLIEKIIKRINMLADINKSY